MQENKLNFSQETKPTSTDYSHDELQSIVSKFDLNNMADIIKNTLAAKQAKRTENQEGEEQNQNIGFQSFQEKRDKEEDSQETPKFGLQHSEEKSIQQKEKGPIFKELDIETVREHLQQRQEEKRPKFVRFDLPQRTLDTIPSKFKLYTKNSTTMNIQLGRIQNLPLYGIDHGKSFFENHEILSERLKIQQSLTDYFCNNNGIRFESFTEGIEINENLKLSGPELKQVLSIIFLTTFRKIEQFIVLVCKKNIVKTQNKDLQIIFPILFQARNILTESHMTTLFIMMRQAFDLPSKPTQKEVIAFYTFLLDIIDSKKQQQELKFQYGDSHFQWDQQKQQRLCQLYIKHKSVQSLLLDFNKEFNSKVSVCFLRLKLETIVKNMLKHIEYQILKQDRQRKLSYYLSKKDYQMIARDIKAYDLRILLIKVYIQGNIFLEDLKNIIVEMSKIIEGTHINSEQKTPINNRATRKKKRKISDEESNQLSLSEQQSELSIEEIATSTKKLRKLRQIEQPQKNHLGISDSFQRNEVRGSSKDKVLKNNSLKNALVKNDLFKKKGPGKGQRSR